MWVPWLAALFAQRAKTLRLSAAEALAALGTGLHHAAETALRALEVPWREGPGSGKVHGTQTF